MKEPIIAGVDAGSSSVKTVIARVVNHEQLEVIGIGESESQGILKGVIVNIEAAADSIQKSINQAEHMAGISAPDVIATIGGDHISCLNSNGVIGVNTKDKEITKSEVERVLDSAKNVLIPQDREIIETIEQEYSLDGQDEIKNPIGMSGTRLETRVHLVTGAKYVSENLRKTLHRMNFTGKDLLVNIRGSAEAVLTNDEKELGVVAIDIGHSTTSLMVFLQGYVWHTAIIPVGSNHITNDISKCVKVTVPIAEKLKCDHGYAFIDLVGDKELVEVPTASGKMKTLQKKVLTEIIQPRVEEILFLCSRELSKMPPLDILAGGIVFTGGGSLIPGLVELAREFKTNLPATSRIGIPDKIIGIKDIHDNPAYSAVVGALMMSLDEATNVNIQSNKKSSDKKFKFNFGLDKLTEFFK